MRERVCVWFYAGGLVPVMRVLFVLVLFGGLVSVASFCSGCGASERQQHLRLNTLTSVADPTYALAVETCDAARDFILARPGSTYAEDRAAFDEIAAVCDPMVAGFEALIGSQLTARAALDAGASGAVREAILAAVALWAQLQQMIPALEALGREGSE